MNNVQSPSQPSPQNNPQTSPEENQPSLVERVASLEASNKALAEVVNANGAIMRDCLEVTEARQWMIMRAMDDMVSSNTGAKFAGEGVNITGIDWEHYKTQYLAFQETLRAQAESAPPEAAEEDIPADAVVFGGSGG